MANTKPVAFISSVRSNFQHDGGGVARFRERLADEVKAGGSPTLHGNRIYENQESGVYIYDDGQGDLEDKDISRNARAEMRIGNSGRPILRNNRTKIELSLSGHQCNGGGDIEEDDLLGNAYGAWKVSADSDPLLKHSSNLE